MPEKNESAPPADVRTKAKGYRSRRDHVNALPDTLKKKYESLQAELVGYRLLLMELYDHPRRMDRTLWEDFEAISAKKGRYLKKSFRFWLRFPLLSRRRIRLYENLIDEIDELNAFVDKAKSGALFYSKMQRGKSIKRQTVALEGEPPKEVRGSLHALIRSLHYIFLREKMGQQVTAGSSVLHLGDALVHWQGELDSITAYMRDGRISKTRLVKRINDLRERLQQAPAQARVVLDFEMQVLNLLKHTKANQSAADTKVPDDVLVELLRSFDVDIPGAWARGEWDTLERSLHRARELITGVEAFSTIRSSKEAPPPTSDGDTGSHLDLAKADTKQLADGDPLQTEPLEVETVETILKEMLAGH